MGQNSLFQMKLLANEDRRLEEIRRRSGRPGYWLVVLPFLAFWPFFLVYDVLSSRGQTASFSKYDPKDGD